VLAPKRAAKLLTLMFSTADGTHAVCPIMLLSAGSEEVLCRCLVSEAVAQIAKLFPGCIGSKAALPASVCNYDYVAQCLTLPRESLLPHLFGGHLTLPALMQLCCCCCHRWCVEWQSTSPTALTPRRVFGLFAGLHGAVQQEPGTCGN
jgi:hypothetical protein